MCAKRQPVLIVNRYRLRSKDPVHFVEMYNRVSAVKYATNNKKYVAYRMERGNQMVLLELINTGNEIVREEMYVPFFELPKILKDLGFAA